MFGGFDELLDDRRQREDHVGERFVRGLALKGGEVDAVAELVVLRALVAEVDVLEGERLGLDVVFLVEGLITRVFQETRLYLADVHFERSGRRN